MAGHDDLWQRSVARLDQGIVVEWGGLLEIDGERLRLVGQVSGTDVGLRLVVPLDSAFIGSFHTHPDPHGRTGIGFSGADFADAVNQGERISLVQSGQDVFVILRTENTPLIVSVDELRGRMNALFVQTYQMRRSVIAASLIANRSICQELALAFYYGRVFGQLVEVY